MIPRLASPSVCVIDDEVADYQPILDALMKLGIACVHVRGDSASPLPPQPFKGLRIVFTDLHLSNSSGKNVAAHTANVFRHVVSDKTAPVLVVIWSKHRNDPAGEEELPPDDQPTLAEAFKNELLQATPTFESRLIFTEMPKLMPGDRKEDWVENIQADIEKQLANYAACGLLWSWESLVRDATISISEALTSLAEQVFPASGEKQDLNESLGVVFRHLTKEQGGPACSQETAHEHLTAALAQCLADELENVDGLGSLSTHGPWLSSQDELQKTPPFASQLNALLLTAATKVKTSPFVPGTIYHLSDAPNFEKSFGISSDEFLELYFQHAKKGVSAEEWKKCAVRVALEISPACDFHQGTRRQALLIAGVLAPVAARPNVKSADAIQTFPTFRLRWPLGDDPEQDVVMAFCSRCKLTIPQTELPGWLKPWFRLRELPTASLRNWHSSHASRVGYVSL